MPANNNSLNNLYDLLRRHYHNPDLQAVRIVLGTIASHYLDIGDPAWLFLVAPPSSGKSTLTMAGASNLPQVVLVSEITESTFLSGFYGHKTPGVLEKLGPTVEKDQVFTTTGNGILLFKDFTTVCAMHRDKRAAILAQLREIHDGSWSRRLGTGVTKQWVGQVTVVAAVTPSGLDEHYAIQSTLGERFLQVRWNRPDVASGEMAIKQQGANKQIRTELQAEVKRVFEGPSRAQKMPSLSQEQTTHIAQFAESISIGRTHVARESYTREIVSQPQPEGCARIAKALASIARGLASLHGRSAVSAQDLQDAFRVGLDSLPPVRRKVWLAKEPTKVDLPETTLSRTIEDLLVLGLFSRTKDADAFRQRGLQVIEKYREPLSRVVGG